jgi:hypothetical protein
MTGLFRYSIVRFRPFAETEEFANIGVVVLDVQRERIAFELAPKRFVRIKHFFDEGAHNAYAAAIAYLSIELGRAAEYLPLSLNVRASQVFEDLIKPRESSIIFSPARAISTDTSADLLAVKLFSRYVKRESSTPENAEHVLTRDIRMALHTAGLRHFKAAKISDDVVPVNFPLAYDDGALHAIRPLAFSQRNPLGIFDYGAHWRRRLSYLIERGKIKEGNVLLAVNGPNEKTNRSMLEAYGLALEELRRLPFDLVTAENNGVVNEAIVDFAQRVTPRQGNIIH